MTDKTTLGTTHVLILETVWKRFHLYEQLYLARGSCVCGKVYREANYSKGCTVPATTTLYQITPPQIQSRYSCQLWDMDLGHGTAFPSKQLAWCLVLLTLDAGGNTPGGEWLCYWSQWVCWLPSLGCEAFKSGMRLWPRMLLQPSAHGMRMPTASPGPNLGQVHAFVRMAFPGPLRGWFPIKFCSTEPQWLLCHLVSHSCAIFIKISAWGTYGEPVAGTLF